MTSTTVQLEPGRHRKPEPVTSAFLVAQDLGTDHLKAWFAPVYLEQCQWCQQRGHRTTVQVYGRPRPDILGAITCTACCQCCAGKVIDLAMSQLDPADDRDIVIEFGYPLEVAS